MPVSKTNDRLIEMLNERTGSKFSLVEPYSASADTKPYFRSLLVEREGHSWTFFQGGLAHNKMAMYLSSLVDMIDMGFIPMPKEEEVPA